MQAPGTDELEALLASGQPGSEQVQRSEWQSAFGLIVIEITGERVFVNGELVEPAKSDSP